VACRIGTEIHGNLAHLQIEHDPRRGGAGTRPVAKHHGGTQGGVAAEGDLLGRNEDSNFHALFTFDGSVARNDESGFLQIGLARQILHLCIAQTAAVEKYREPIAL
jgi:hypothetical protein